MKVMIAGGGRTGEQLAALLLANNHSVCLIEHRKDVLSLIHRELPTEAIYEGDCTDPAILAQAGISEVDVFAACTRLDDVNLVLCNFAKQFFGVKRTIARVNNPRNAWLFDAKFHVDFALNAAQILASLIEEEMDTSELVTLLKLGRGRYSLVEEHIPEGCQAIGKAIRDLPIPRECVIAGIMRAGELVVPRGDTVVQAGDELLSITDRPGAEQLGRIFAAA